MREAKKQLVFAPNPFLFQRSSLPRVLNLYSMPVPFSHSIFFPIPTITSAKPELILQTFNESILLNQHKLKLLDLSIKVSIFLSEQSYHLGSLGQGLLFELSLIHQMFDSHIIISGVAGTRPNGKFRQFLTHPCGTFSMLRHALMLSCLSISSCFEVKNLF